MSASSRGIKRSPHCPERCYCGACKDSHEPYRLNQLLCPGEEQYSHPVLLSTCTRSLRHNLAFPTVLLQTLRATAGVHADKYHFQLLVVYKVVRISSNHVSPRSGWSTHVGLPTEPSARQPRSTTSWTSPHSSCIQNVRFRWSETLAGTANRRQ